MSLQKPLGFFLSYDISSGFLSVSLIMICLKSICFPRASSINRDKKCRRICKDLRSGRSKQIKLAIEKQFEVIHSI